MLELLTSLQVRVETAEHRASWPSAVQSDEQGWDLFVSASVIEDPGYPEAEAIPVATLSLDPGRWILFGQVTEELWVVNGVSEIGMILRWQSGIQVETRQAARRNVIIGDYEDLPSSIIEGTLTLAMEVISKEPISATVFSFFGRNFGSSSGLGFIQSAKLLAFPG